MTKVLTIKQAANTILRNNERFVKGQLQTCGMITFGSVLTAEQNKAARKQAVLWLANKPHARMLTQHSTGYVTGAIDGEWRAASKIDQHNFDRRVAGAVRASQRERDEEIQRCRRWAAKLGYDLIAKPEQPMIIRTPKSTDKIALYESGGGLTWSGRGKKPQWMQDQLDGGAKLSEYLNPAHPDYEKAKVLLERKGQ